MKIEAAKFTSGFANFKVKVQFEESKSTKMHQKFTFNLPNLNNSTVAIALFHCLIVNNIERLTRSRNNLTR